MYQYPYGNAQQLNLDWLMEQWQEVKQSIDGSLQGEIDRVEAAITDLLNARNAAVAAAGAAGTSANAAAQSAQAAAADAATASAQAAAANTARSNAAQSANNAQTYAGNAQTQAAAAANSAGAAATSASQAAASASDAHDDAVAASGSATNASTSAVAAQQSFNLADAARQAAQAAAQDAQDVLDSIPEDYSELSADVSDLQTALVNVKDDIIKYNSFSIIASLDNGTKTAKGITWTWDGQKITATGTSTGTSNFDIFSDANALPPYFEVGKEYYVKYSSQNIRFRIYDYTGGTTSAIIGTFEDARFTLPETCTGLIIRFSIATGLTVNETVYPVVLNSLTNVDIENQLKTANVVDADVNNLQTITRNLLDPSTSTQGFLIANGVPTANTDWSYTDFIDVRGLGSIFYSYQGNQVTLCACYDIDKEYIGQVVSHLPEQNTIVNTGTYQYNRMTLPVGTAYIRANYRYITNLMLTPYFFPSVKLDYLQLFALNAPKTAAFGDSIMLGTNGNGGTVSENIPYWLNQNIGFPVTNYAEGSMGWKSTAYNPRIAYDKISETDLTGFDLIILCYGTNDSAATLGTYDSTDENTIMGQINKCVNYIGSQNSTAKIIIISPWNGAAYGTFPDWRYTVRTSGGFTREEMQTEIAKLCNYYHIGFISQIDSPLNGYGIGLPDGTKTNTFLGGDNVHPTPLGYKAIGRWLSAKIKSLID